MSVFKLKVTKQSVDEMVLMIPRYKIIINNAKASKDKKRVRSADRVEDIVNAMQHFADIAPGLEMKKDCYIISKEYYESYREVRFYLSRKRLFKWLR